MNLDGLNPNYLPTPILEQTRCEQEVRQLRERMYSLEQIDSDVARDRIEQIKKRLVELGI